MKRKRIPRRRWLPLLLLVVVLAIVLAVVTRPTPPVNVACRPTTMAERGVYGRVICYDMNGNVIDMGGSNGTR